MNNRQPKMKELENEIAQVEINAVAEEQSNVDQNYMTLDAEREINKAKIPYQDVGLYDCGADYDDRADINHKKDINGLYWKEIEELNWLCDNGALFVGHLLQEDKDTFFMSSSLAKSRLIKVGGREVSLVNVNDAGHQSQLRVWRFPEEHSNVAYSRNMVTHSRKVKHVDVVLDRESTLFKNITDGYLRKALLRNKGAGVQSIIQTIQKKQDNIRSLPQAQSFVVQGCAGSGKTMVLLHRLSYLLYNQCITHSDYTVLVPSNQFKNFIEDAASSFGIRKENIIPFYEYYQRCLGKTVIAQSEASELVFPSEYLERVYSKKFMQEAYKIFFDALSLQISNLLKFCETNFNNIIENEKSQLIDEREHLKKGAVETIRPLINALQIDLTGDYNENYESLIAVVDEIDSLCLKKEVEYAHAIDPIASIEIAQDDERILSNKDLNQIKSEIIDEEKAIEKASIFTLIAHKNKLSKLRAKYDALYEQFIDILIEEEKNNRIKNAQKLLHINEHTTVHQIRSEVELIKSNIRGYDEKIGVIQEKIDKLEGELENRFSDEIKALNSLINISGDISNIMSNHISNLSSGHELFDRVMSEGALLLKSFTKQLSQKEKDIIKSHMPFFGERKDNRVHVFLHNVMLGICKKNIQKEFGIKICENYKHYWYLSLYCAYLTRSPIASAKRYLFIDEAQDLSVSEIQLIEKINTKYRNPVMNLFGDVNQMISSHGINDWAEVTNVQTKHELIENFRNTNQIIEYCNQNTSMHMIKIGVDMNPVKEYETVQALLSDGSVKNDTVFIVKDDYSVIDLKNQLDDLGIDGCEILTVKSAKGLEFKEIYVVEEGMTERDKYISYTRALVKLNVIKRLPQLAKREQTLIAQGEAKDSETLQ